MNGISILLWQSLKPRWCVSLFKVDEMFSIGYREIPVFTQFVIKANTLLGLMYIMEIHFCMFYLIVDLMMST